MAVFDANVLVALLVDLPWSPAARQAVAGHETRLAPSLLPVEVGSAIWQNVSKGSLDAEHATPGLRHLTALVKLVPVETLSVAALELAIEHRHPIHDCCYVALAGIEGLALVTADRRLASLAGRAGVTVKAIR